MREWKNIFELSSKMFHLAQPDLYWEFSNLLEDIEQQETFSYQEDCEDDAPERRYYISAEYAREHIAELWMEMFGEKLKKVFPKVKMIFGKAGNPKFYNYGGDWTDFELKMSKNMYQKICKSAMEAEGFEDFIAEEYCDRPGFWSFMPDTMPKYIERFNGRQDHNIQHDREAALVVALQFHIFRGEKERDAWRDEIWEKALEIDYTPGLYYEEDKPDGGYDVQK